MTCREREYDLLMLRHGELGAARRLATALHLRRCPHCQDRSHDLAAVSQLMADAIGDPAGASPNSFQPPRLRGQGARTVRQVLRASVAFLALLALIALLGYWSSSVGRSALEQATGVHWGPKTASAPAIDHCNTPR